MPELDFVSAVRDFIETGGDVLRVIAVVTFAMWLMILERFWYFRLIQPEEAERVVRAWESRRDHSSWRARHVRRLLISEMELDLERGLLVIKALVALCPMLGLLGTVTGMIEVFDVMALSGTGNARGMAGGVSKATLPTMAGMVAALSGVIFSAQLQRRAKREAQKMADRLVIAHA